MTTKINPNPSDKDVQKSLTEIVNALASDNGEYETKMRNEMFESAESHVERTIESYITLIEGSPCSCDKKDFVVRKMRDSIASGKNIRLQETYAEYYERIGKPIPDSQLDYKDSLTIWSPDTIKDTDEAFDIVYAIESINGIPSLLKKKQKEMLPVIARRKAENIAYYAKEAARAKPYYGGLTVFGYLDSKKPFIMTIYDSATGKRIASARKGSGFGKTPDDEYTGSIPDEIGKMKIAKLDERVDRHLSSMLCSSVYVDAGDLGKWKDDDNE